MLCHSDAFTSLCCSVNCWSVRVEGIIYISRFHSVHNVAVWLETISAGSMITFLMSVWDQGRGWPPAPCVISYDRMSRAAWLLLWILVWKLIWGENNFLPCPISLFLSLSACSLSFYFGIKLLSLPLHTDLSFHSHSKMTELRISRNKNNLGLLCIQAHRASRVSFTYKSFGIW